MASATETMREKRSRTWWKSQRLEDMDYNDLLELYKSVRTELIRRNNEIETLIIEDIDYEHRRINENEGKKIP